MANEIPKLVEVRKERSVAQCEKFAEQNGFTGMVAGHFPNLPYPPPPTFKPALEPSQLRLNTRRVVEAHELDDDMPGGDDG